MKTIGARRANSPQRAGADHTPDRPARDSPRGRRHRCCGCGEIRPNSMAGRAGAAGAGASTGFLELSGIGDPAFFKAASRAWVSANSARAHPARRRRGAAPTTFIPGSPFADPDRLAGLGIPPVHTLRGVGEGVLTLNDVMRSPARKMLFGLRYLFSRDGLMATTTATVHALARSSPEQTGPDMKLQLHPLSAADTRHPDRLELDEFSGFGIGTFPLRPASTCTTSPRAITRSGRITWITPTTWRAPSPRSGSPAGWPRSRRVRLRRRGGAPRCRCALGQGHRRLHPRDRHHLVSPGRDLPHGHRCGRWSIRSRVIGLQGLRVADASIFPTMPSSSTHAPSILVGEMAASLVNEA